MRTKAGHGPLQRLASRTLTLVALAIVAGGAVAWRATEVPREPDGKAGRSRPGCPSSRARCVEASPSSAAAAGFDSERVWSGYDDWEPALAADPNSSYVYQMTTRYSGPKACNGCPFPVIVFRSSSDGGTTWGADRFLAISKNKQNDPMIEVAADGTLYAGWLDAYTPGVKFLQIQQPRRTWSTPFQFTSRKTPRLGRIGRCWRSRPTARTSTWPSTPRTATSPRRTTSARAGGPTCKTNNDTRYWFHTGGAVRAQRRRLLHHRRLRAGLHRRRAT